MPKSLTEAQQRALRMLSEDEPYYRRAGSPNWYHAQHRPGNFYVDARTARVLIEQGLAQVNALGHLYRTPAGTQYARERR